MAGFFDKRINIPAGPREAASARRAEARSGGENLVRWSAIGAMAFLFVFVPLILTRSIIFLEPEMGAGVIALLLAVIMVALPFNERETNTKLFFGMLVAYILANVLWPDYIAITIPGLPYITPSRAILTVLIFIWVFVVATSRPLYRRLTSRLNGLKLIAVPLLLIFLLKILAIPFSPYTALAMKGFMDQLITWYLPFLLAVSLFNSRENILLGMKAFVIGASVVGVTVLIESFTHVNLYTSTLGRFITVDERWLEEIFTPQFRDANKYRASGPFVVHLSMAEFMTLCMPFALYWREKAQKAWVRFYLLVAVALMGYGVYAADSRTGMVTFGFIFSLYFIVTGALVVHRDHRSLWRPIISFCVIMAAFSVVPVGIYAISQLNWENAFGATGTRMVQLQLAGPLVAERPVIGYGPGNGLAALMLNYKPNGRDLTIDNYYLTTILETGIPGFLLFLFIPGTLIYVSFRRALEVRPDARLYLALGLFGLSFAMIRLTLSQNENMNLFYIFLGAFVVLYGLPERDEPEPARAHAGPEPAAKKRVRSFRRLGRHGSAYGARRWRWSF